MIQTRQVIANLAVGLRLGRLLWRTLFAALMLILAILPGTAPAFSDDQIGTPPVQVPAADENSPIVLRATWPIQPQAPDADPPAGEDAPVRAPMIGILIDDLGINGERAELMAALPAPLTLAFMPYGEHVAGLAALAASHGHELFLHLPMQPIDDTIDPGPHALLASFTPEELLKQLRWNLDQFEGYIGVNNHMGSLLTQDEEAMNIVMAELGTRDLIFVDSLTAGGSVAYGEARRNGMSAAIRDLFIDNVAERTAILAQLAALESIALRQGHALGIGHPYDVTAEALAEWLPDVQARGFVIVPVSTIVERCEQELALAP